MTNINDLKKVKILGIEYNVIFSDLVLIDDAEVAGKIDCEQQTIEINNNLAEDRKRQTLLHEIIHGILWETDRSMFHKEDFIQRLASSIFLLNKENKELFSLFLQLKQV